MNKGEIKYAVIENNLEGLDIENIKKYCTYEACSRSINNFEIKFKIHKI